MLSKRRLERETLLDPVASDVRTLVIPDKMMTGEATYQAGPVSLRLAKPPRKDTKVDRQNCDDREKHLHGKPRVSTLHGVVSGSCFR